MSVGGALYADVDDHKHLHFLTEKSYNIVIIINKEFQLRL